MTDKVQKIKDWISCQQDSLIDANGNFQHSEDEAVYHTLCNLDAYIDFIQEEPVSEELEEASVNYAATGEFLPNGKEMIDFQLEKAFKAGAKWQKEQMLSEEKK